VTRLASQHLSDSDRAGVMAVVRGVFAVPFVMLLPIWGLAADAGMSLLAIYPGIAAIAALHLLVILRHWPHDRTAPWVELKSGLRFRAALAEILTPPVLARVQLVGILQTGGALAGVLVGLCFDAAGRSTGQVGFFFSLFVGVEVLGTLLLGTLSARLARSRIILIGVLLYAVFLVGMPVLAAGPWIWAMAFFAGLGGALIYTPVIAYVQDLLGARAGAGASLLALGRIGQDGATAAAFGIGTFLGGYGLAGVLGAVFTCAAITAIIVLDRSRV